MREDFKYLPIMHLTSAYCYLLLNEGLFKKRQS